MNAGDYVPLFSPAYRRRFFRDWKRDDEALAMILCMVCVEVELDVIARWSDAMCQDAGVWAAREHFRASDNIVRRVPKPAFLPDFVSQTWV